MADHRDLLERFRPQLKYDSNEAFFADSAAEWTDNPGNVLRRVKPDSRPGSVIAAATPEPGQHQLSLPFLGHPSYADGTEARADDVISTSRRDYREMYMALRQRPGYANRMYGRAKEDADGRLWLQYWFYYFYNDYNLAGGFGLHEGDWEMVQFRMGLDGHHPDIALYAQHRHAERAVWEDLEKLPDSLDTAVVYVARGSHASYFQAGYHETEAWYDMADGKRPTPRLELEVIGDDEPRWVTWRGRWGDTRARIPGIEQPSPDGPCAHKQWDDPRILLEDVKTHVPRTPVAAPEVRVERRTGRLAIEFDFSGRAGHPPEKIVVTVNSVDDRLPPQTYTFGVEGALRGTLETRVDAHPAKHYDVYVSTTDSAGRPSESRLTVLDPVAQQRQRSWQSVLPRVGRLVAWARERFSRH